MTTAFGRVFGQTSIRDIGLIIGSSVATTFAVIAVARLTLQSAPKNIFKSPRDTLLPKLSKSEQAELPYPPDAFPGARDVLSPYGTTRVYEWGPENGRKVLFLHGITTPCVALGGVANGLVERGCRVMLMDLFGRGYSDCPNLPHDSRLYSTQVLLAITSSPLAWTPEGFSVIGYSLGGGIAVDLAVYFPELVKAVVLLAPGGLIRSHHFGWQSRLMYSSWVPEAILHMIVGMRMKGAPTQRSNPKTGDAEKVVSADTKGNRDIDFESAPLSKNRPDITVASVVQWQIDNHDGFVRTFVSCLRNASIEGQGEVWRMLGKRKDKVLIIVGKSDSVVVPEELRDDAIEAIGKNGVEWRVIEAGHEFPITKSEEVVSEITGIWGI